MSEPAIDPLEYYAQHGIMTDPREHGDLLAGLPHVQLSLRQREAVAQVAESYTGQWLQQVLLF